MYDNDASSIISAANKWNACTLMNDIEVSIAEVGENTAKIVGIEPYYYGTVNVTFDVGQYDICDWVDQNV
ncbi:MAG: hypothetical protein LBS95_00540, partial [Mycoplasmataceae bacterium]|nr:hypothetical protein [Mycoplasmataceae bacterium]